MNQQLKNKTAQYKRMANNSAQSHSGQRSGANREDSLTQVIRNPKEAEQFMAELENATKRSK